MGPGPGQIQAGPVHGSYCRRCGESVAGLQSLCPAEEKFRCFTTCCSCRVDLRDLQACMKASCTFSYPKGETWRSGNDTVLQVQASHVLIGIASSSLAGRYNLARQGGKAARISLQRQKL